MKARYATFSVQKIDKEIRKEVLKELDKYKNEVYDNVCWDVFQQALAVCFTALELMGWRKKRLHRFQDRVEDVCHLLLHGVMGREVTTKDAIKHLHDAYGIDFEQSVYDDQRGGGSDAAL